MSDCQKPLQLQETTTLASALAYILSALGLPYLINLIPFNRNALLVLPVILKLFSSLSIIYSSQQKKQSNIVDLLYYGKGRVAIKYVRVRMGCNDLNVHLFKIGVVYSPTYSCGLGHEDTIHYCCFFSII